MAKGLVRYQQAGDLHFITFSCSGRRPFLATPTVRNIFERSLETMRVRYHFVILGYIVMPEHVHLLVGEPKNAPLSKAIQALKLSVAVQRSQRPFWQARYYDFNVFTNAKRVREVEIHAPQSRRTRLGRRTGRVDPVQLPALLNGRDRNGAHRELSWNDSGSAAMTPTSQNRDVGHPRLCQSGGHFP